MSVRSFDGAGDLLVCSIGGLASNNSGANTWAVLLKRIAVADQGVLTLHNSGAGLQNGHVLGSVGNNSELGYQSNAGGTFVAGLQILTADGWMVAALTKASGTVAPVGHKCILGGANTHTTAAATVADHAANDLAGGSVRFGGGTFGDYNGYIAAAGVLNSVLSDGNIESLKASWAAWQALFTGAGAGLWRLDQAATSNPVNDQTPNGANETSLTGTTVVNGDDPPGFLWGGAPVGHEGARRIWPGRGPYVRNRWRPPPAADVVVAAGPTIVALEQVVETEVALPVTVRKLVTLGQPAETEVAQAATVRKLVALGLAAEAELAQPVAVRELVAIGQATETELAQPVTAIRKVPIGQVVEVELAQPVAVRETVALGQVVETELAQAVTVRRLVPIGLVVEVELAQPIVVKKKVALGQVVEVELAQPMTIAGVTGGTWTVGMIPFT